MHKTKSKETPEGSPASFNIWGKRALIADFAEPYAASTFGWRPGVGTPSHGTNHTLRYCTSFAGCDDVAPVSKSLECDSMRLDRPEQKSYTLSLLPLGRPKVRLD